MPYEDEFAGGRIKLHQKHSNEHHMNERERDVGFDKPIKEPDEKAELIERLNQRIEEAKETLRQIKKWSIIDRQRINECLLDFKLVEAEQIINLAHYLLSIEKTIAAIEKIPEDSMEKARIIKTIRRAESVKEIHDFFAQKTIQEFFVAHGVSFQNDDNSIQLGRSMAPNNGWPMKKSNS